MSENTVLVLGGEGVSERLKGKLVQRYGRIYNAYGPCEITIFSHVAELTLTTDIHVGKTIDQTIDYVVDSHGHITTDGTPGELWIGGVGMALGYFENTQLTREKFIKNPFAEQAEYPIVYRTGDWVRRLDDGSIQYLSRIDDQVKINGVRIEPGEIEHHLLRHSAVSECRVVCQTVEEQKTLVAFCVGDQSCGDQQLNGFLRQNLPQSMIPKYTVWLDSLPLLANGKVDKKALQQYSLPQVVRKKRQVEELTDTEETLRNIFCRCLGVASVGLNDDFFDLGGDSLLIHDLVTQCQRAFPVLEAKKVIQKPTIKALALMVEGGDETVDETDNVNLSWWQNIKFIAISLVILFHFIHPFIVLCYKKKIEFSGVFFALRTMIEVVALISMPVFSFITGRFSRANISSATIKTLARYIIPSLLLFYLVDGLVFARKDPLYFFFIYSHGAAWYLIAMIVWMFLLPLFSRFRFSCIIAVILSCLAGLKLSPNMVKCFTFFPFFLLGYFYGKRLQGWMEQCSVTCRVAVGSVCFLTGLGLSFVYGAWVVKDPYISTLMIGLVKYTSINSAMSTKLSTSIYIITKLVHFIQCVLVSFSVMCFIPMKQTGITGRGFRSYHAYVFHGLTTGYFYYWVYKHPLLWLHQWIWFMPVVVVIVIVIGTSEWMGKLLLWTNALITRMLYGKRVS